MKCFNNYKQTCLLPNLMYYLKWQKGLCIRSQDPEIILEYLGDPNIITGVLIRGSFPGGSDGKKSAWNVRERRVKLRGQDMMVEAEVRGSDLKVLNCWL